ncbi:QRFP-like peptide receptor [Aplysia californica]|uniref:QRFP-like peptide receptor n=1 Tax=Aplysia californica TaxID=6500 RepID=A0ABM0JR86_APLCA|nr:QRFP-like peptide receptor [Aplysia californica]
MSIMDVRGNLSLPPSSLEQAYCGQNVQLALLSFWLRHTVHVLSHVTAVLGIGFNVINLCVFARQGFQDTINISLSGLAVSDMATSAVFLAYHPASLVLETVYGRKPTELIHLGSWLSYGLTINSSCLALFICLERYLCVAFPLKVKDMITPKVTVKAVIAIFLVTITTVLPAMLALRFSWYFDKYANQTILALIFMEHTSDLANVSYVLSTSIQIPALICLCGVTALLIWLLSGHKKELRGFLDAHTSHHSMRRRKRTAKMVVFLSSVILVCFVPAQLASVATLLNPDFDAGGRHDTAYKLSWAVIFLLHMANSSVNLCFYYSMSSRFRSTLTLMLKRR